MAGGRQPTNVIIANGRKHLTKEEIAERLAAEVQPVPDGISAPGYLTAAQKKRAARLMTHALGGKTLYKISKMNKSGRTWRKSCFNHYIFLFF